MMYITGLTEGLQILKMHLTARAGQLCGHIDLLHVGKGCIMVCKDMLNIGQMYALELAEVLTLCGLLFAGTSFPCKNICVAVCCTLSMAENGVAGEAGIDDNGHKGEGRYEGDGIDGNNILDWDDVAGTGMGEM